jgi:hypothetical protein
MVDGEGARKRERTRRGFLLRLKFRKKSVENLGNFSNILIQE